jgi:hypothetical protein
MIETTADARRRGLLNQDFNLNITHKNLFTSGSEDTTRKDCKLLLEFEIIYLFFCCYCYLVASSSSSLESLSNTSSAGVQSVQSSNLFSSQPRSNYSLSYTKQLSSENPNRLSLTSSLSSSKFEPIGGSSSSLRTTPTPQTTSLPSKMLV